MTVLAEFPVTLKYSPDQPRVPAGDPRGGQWAATGGTAIASAQRIVGEDITWYSAEPGQKFPPEVLKRDKRILLVLSPEGVLTAGIGYDLDTHATLITKIGDPYRYDKYVRAGVEEDAPYTLRDAWFVGGMYNGKYRTGWKAVGKITRAMISAGFSPDLRMHYRTEKGEWFEQTLASFSEYKQAKMETVTLNRHGRLAGSKSFEGIRLDRHGRVVGRKYSPDQPRVPAGSPEGGRWTSEGGISKKVLQREAAIMGLKHEEAYAFDVDGNEVLRKVGGKSEVEFTDAEVRRLKKMKGVVFTHNHPRGHSFSFEDLAFCSNIGASELRVVTPDGKTYRMFPPRTESGKLRWDNQDRLWEMMEEFDAKVRKDFQARINAGRMTVKQAGARHYDEVWRQFTRKYRGYRYVKEG